MRTAELSNVDVRITFGGSTRVLALKECHYFQGSPSWDVQWFLLPKTEWYYVQIRDGPSFAVAPVDEPEWQATFERLGVPYIGRFSFVQQSLLAVTKFGIAVGLGCIFSIIVGWVCYWIAGRGFGIEEVAALTVSGGAAGLITFAATIDSRRNGRFFGNRIFCGLFATGMTAHCLRIVQSAASTLYVTSILCGLLHMIASRQFGKMPSSNSK